MERELRLTAGRTRSGHFVGDVEQPQRVAQDTQQENKIHLFDVSLNYRVSRRWTLALGTPLMDADRINHRTKGVTETTGLGDMVIGARFWVFRPPTESRRNIQVGFGIKLPTGKPDATSMITGTGGPPTGPTTVDQSIWPAGRCRNGARFGLLGISGPGAAVHAVLHRRIFVEPEKYLHRDHTGVASLVGVRPIPAAGRNGLRRSEDARGCD